MDRSGKHDWSEDELSRENAFAHQVSAALQRVDAPEDFTARLMARPEMRRPSSAFAKRNPAGGLLLRFTRPAWRVAFATAALLAVTAGSLHVEHGRMEQRRTEQAAEQFDAALQVTHHALDQVSAKLETTEFGEVQRALEVNGGGK